MTGWELVGWVVFGLLVLIVALRCGLFAAVLAVLDALLD